MAATATATGISLWLCLIHLRMVLSPAPQEMREGAAVWLTRLLLEGRNLYSVTELPASTNVYGILYPLVVWPFAALFGNGFPVHRLVSYASIVGACALLYNLLRREQADPLIAWVGTLLFYVSSIYFVAPLARPDGIGVLLSMASLSCLSRDPLKPAAFSFGLFFALLALATKIHLAFPPFVLSAYIFLFRSRARGTVYGAITVVASVVLFVLLAHRYPAYINVSLVTNAQGGYHDFGHLVTQTRDWFVFSLPLTAGLIAAVISARLATPAGGTERRPLSFFAFATIANGLVFAIWLGWHPGAHMTYLFQLVTPVLIPALLPVVSRQPWPRAVVAAALPVALLWNASYFPWSFHRFSADEARFRQLGGAISAHRNVLGSTEVAGLLALAGRPVLDTGESEYFEVAALDRSLPGLVAAPIIEARWTDFVAGMDNNIVGERYDLIVRSRRWGLIPNDLVAQHYRRVATMNLEFTWSGQQWPVDLWEPDGHVVRRSAAASR